MQRRRWRAYRRALVSLPLVGLLCTVITVQPAHADPVPSQIAQLTPKPDIQAVPRVTVPPAGTVDVPRGPSLAARPVDARAVGPEPPAVTIPAGPTLINQIGADAKARLQAHGLVTGGEVDPDVRKLMPATDQAGILDLPGPVAGAVDEASARIKELTGFDAMAFYRALPEGIPLVTYRLCAETATRPVSCSIPRPLVKPVIADVTGDGTPDILADLLPALDINVVTTSVNAINATQRRLQSVIEQILAGVTDPLKLLELLNLRKQLEREQAQQRYDLTIQLTAGLGLLSARLPTSETHGGELKAQIWAQYDIPAAIDFSRLKRLSVGFDGYRRGASLSTVDWGVYTVDPFAALGSVVDVRATQCHFQPGASIATVAGLADLQDKKLVKPLLASLQQAPVPQKFTARARFDLDKLEGKLDITSTDASRLDGLMLINDRAAQPYHDQFTQVVVDRLPTALTAELTRPVKDGEAEIHVATSTSIDRIEVHNYVYEGTRLDKVADGVLTTLPTDIRVHYASVKDKSLMVTAEANAPLAKTVDVLYFDRALDKTVFKGHLADLPAKARLDHDVAASRVTFGTDSKIGLIEAILQRNEGAVASPATGDHVTLIKDATAIGASARLGGLVGFDVTYGAHPHALLKLNPGGQAFTGAASIDRTHLARVEISNLPAQVEVDLDPAAGKAVYQASAVITKLRAAYANVKTGPTVDGSLYGVPQKVTASWVLGDRTTADVTTSSSLKKIELYANKAYVTQISPTSGEDLQATVEDVPTHVTATADMVAGTLDWTADQPVTSVFAFARVNAAGSYFRVAAKVVTVPAHFDASWGQGVYRFRGISGPIGSATIAATNHDGALAPTGPHLAAHYRAATKEVDASVRIDGLSNVEFSTKDAGYKADFQAARQVVALDADVVLKGDNRYAGLGTLGPIPGHIEVSAAKGAPITYDTGGDSMDLKLQFWVGKEAATKAIGAVPMVPNGITAVDKGCTGAGCATDDGPFCTEKRGCFGAAGFLTLTGLPTKVTVDLEKKIFSFSGWQPKDRKLEIYVDSKILSPVPIKAKATLTELPSAITKLEVGPFDVGKEKDSAGRDINVVKVNYSAEAPATLGSLDVLAEADTGDDYGLVRGQAIVSPVPATLGINGKYGKQTHIDVANSAPLDQLSVAATVTHNDKDGTGLVTFEQVPAKFSIDADASGLGLQVPNFTYTAAGGEDTLDGLFAVQGPLIAKVWKDKPADIDILDVSFDLTDLGGTTTVRINEDYSVQMRSEPEPTGQLDLHAGVAIGDVPNVDVDWTAGGIGLKGHYGIRPSSIKDLNILVTAVKELNVRPGKAPFGLGDKIPKWAGFVFPGFDGVFGKVDVALNEVDLNPDVKFSGTGPIPDPELPGHIDKVVFHRYHPHCGKEAIDWTPDIHTTPSRAELRDNAITVTSEEPNTLFFLDIRKQDGDTFIYKWLVSLMAYATWPYEGASIGLGDC